MGKKTVKEIGKIKIKMDTKDSEYFDAKEPHVSFEENGRVTIKHLLLSEVDMLCGNDADEKDAIRWVAKNKEMLVKMYYELNR